MIDIHMSLMVLVCTGKSTNTVSDHMRYIKSEDTNSKIFQIQRCGEIVTTLHFTISRLVWKLTQSVDIIWKYENITIRVPKYILDAHTKPLDNSIGNLVVVPINLLEVFNIPYIALIQLPHTDVHLKLNLTPDWDKVVMDNRQRSILMVDHVFDMLPVEIWHNIMDKLDDKDFLNLRSVNRFLYSVPTDQYMVERFAFDADKTYKSISALVDVTVMDSNPRRDMACRGGDLMECRDIAEYQCTHTVNAKLDSSTNYPVEEILVLASRPISSVDINQDTTLADTVFYDRLETTDPKQVHRISHYKPLLSNLDTPEGWHSQVLTWNSPNNISSISVNLEEAGDVKVYISQKRLLMNHSGLCWEQRMLN